MVEVLFDFGLEDFGLEDFGCEDFGLGHTKKMLDFPEELEEKSKKGSSSSGRDWTFRLMSVEVDVLG